MSCPLHLLPRHCSGGTRWAQTLPALGARTGETLSKDRRVGLTAWLWADMGSFGAGEGPVSFDGLATVTQGPIKTTGAMGFVLKHRLRLVRAARSSGLGGPSGQGLTSGKLSHN